MNQFDYSQIDHLLPSLRAYIKDGRSTGGFLHAVLTNDLKGAVQRADSTNLFLIPVIVTWLINEAPSACWGDEETVETWWDGHYQKRLSPPEDTDSLEDRGIELGSYGS